MTLLTIGIFVLLYGIYCSFTIGESVSELSIVIVIVLVLSKRNLMLYYHSLGGSTKL